MGKILTILSLVLILFIVLLTQQSLFVLANGNNSGDSVGLPNPLGTDNIVILLNRILNALVTGIAPPILAIMILIGSFQILFASGDPQKFKTGKKTIIYAIVGYTALLLSLGIVSIIKEILSKGS